jgi:hypothetical protein
MSSIGGALALITQPFIKENFNNSLHLGISLLNSRFESNLASSLGGALYLENPAKAVINGCTFRGNQASSASVEKNLKGFKPPKTDEERGARGADTETGSGGAIYYVCDPLTNGTLDCDLKITSTTFQ